MRRPRWPLAPPPGPVMSERVTVRVGPNASLELSLSEDAGCWPALLLTNMALSVLACSCLVAASSQQLLLAALAVLTAADSLLNQGLTVLFQIGQPPFSCLPLAFSTLFFFVFQISFLASLSVFPSLPTPMYLHLIIPSILALCISIPFAFPQVAVARYIHSRLVYN